jgi:streptomycin 6-kinase
MPDRAVLELPSRLVRAARDEGREEWLSTLPAIVERFSGEWSLQVGPPFQPGGHTAWVAPAVGRTGENFVLKVAWRHPEAEHEADALLVWAGNGAVRSHAAAELNGTIVMLLEHAVPGTPLSGVPEPDQDAVIASLLQRLWVTPPSGHRFRSLAEMCDRWADEFETRRAAGLVDLDSGLAEEGIGLLRSLPRTADRGVLLCTDLHAGNVLSAQRERWLVIDPKPYLGDPTYDVLQHLINCDTRLAEDPLALVIDFASRLDLDRERLRQWLFVRCVQESPNWPGLAGVAHTLAVG